MSCRASRSGVIAGAAIFASLISSNAFAHGFAGSRFFPATLATDDPFVADEFALPTVAFFKDSDDVRTSTYSVDFAKRITQRFGLEFGATWLQLKPPGGPTVDGFDNLSLGAKYQLYLDAPSETILSIGVDADLGGTGAKRIGAEDFSVISPTFFFGKGFGDVFDQMSPMRALAVTGSIGIGIPTKARSSDGEGGYEEHPDTFQLGLALEYSLPYFNTQIKNLGMGSLLARLVPLVELSLETPIDRGGGKTTGTVNPGVLLTGQYVQFSAEAIIPVNRDSGHNVGFIAQLHFYIDDIFPNSLGRPLIR